LLTWITNCFAALLVSAALVVILKRVSPVLSLVDHPDRRKLHDGVVPLCGGIAIFATFALVMLLRDRAASLPLNFWVGLFITLIVGVIDDRTDLPAVRRLAAQFVVALTLVNPFSGSAIATGIALPQVLLAVSFPILAIVAVLFVVGLINAWNMIDGVDGLAGGCAAVSLLWLAIIASYKGVTDLILPILVLFAAVCGFLAFNMRSPWVARAKIFLGDGGSTALGAVIAYLIITLSIRANIAFPVLLWIVIVPIVDTLSLIVRRSRAGRSPFSADRWHLHHLLLDREIPPAKTTLTIIAASALCGGIACASIVMEASNLVMTLALLVPFVAHSSFVYWSRATAEPTPQRRVNPVPQLTSIPPTAVRAELNMSHASVQPAANPRPSILSDAV